MGYYAVVKGEIVDGIAISDSPLETDGIWIDVTNINPMPQANWKYINGVFSPPNNQPRPPVDRWTITKLAMISRFTNAEYVGILSAKKSDVTVEAWYDEFQALPVVELKDQRFIDGMNFLVSKNLLTQTRSNEILNTPAKGNEY